MDKLMTSLKLGNLAPDLGMRVMKKVCYLDLL